MRFAAQVNFDLGQEVGRIKKEMEEVAEQDAPGKGRETLDRLFFAADSVSAYMDVAEKALKAPIEYREGNRKNPVLNVARWEYTRNLYARRLQERPGAKITELGQSVEFWGVNSALAGNKQVQEEIGERLDTDKTYAAAIGKALRAGELGKHMQVSFDTKTYQNGLQIMSKKEIKAEIKRETRSEQLRETVRKNAEKEAEMEAKKAEPKAKASGRRR